MLIKLVAEETSCLWIVDPNHYSFMYIYTQYINVLNRETHTHNCV